MKILVLNAGSSSQKCKLYELPDSQSGAVLPVAPPKPLWKATVDWTHQSDAAEVSIEAGDQKRTEVIPTNNHKDALAHLLRSLTEGERRAVQDKGEIAAIGHRVVHGGAKLTETVRLTAEVRAEIERLTELAPAHNPPALEGMAAADTVFGGDIPQFAAFDTAFHSAMPPEAATYPVPRAWREGGIRRYGFHGLSHRYASARAGELLRRDVKELRLVTCHLGNGCSLCAVAGGLSVDTTMGFTPLEGLMMGTRSGTIDPAIVLHLLRTGPGDIEAIDKALNKESGLKGVSEVSGDLRQVTKAAEGGNDAAKLALAMFIHSLRRHIGAMLGVLGGADALVFTGGIGENSALIREKSCTTFGFAGVRLDTGRNTGFNLGSDGDGDIAEGGWAVRVLVVGAQEEWQIARDGWRLLNRL